MLQKIIHAIARPRHPWRTMEFDELAEIYTSMSLRALGFGIIGIFVPVYLYQQGVDLQSIFWMFTWIFILRIPVAFLSGYVVGRIGPKHSIAVSTLLFIVFLAMLLSYSTLGWPLVSLALAFTISNGLFFVAYNTDFSKVKDSKNSGKELGWLYIFERAGGALGPLVGGLVASLLAPELSIVLAIAVLLGSLVPLFLSNEPVRVHQNIHYRGFAWRKHTRAAISLGAFNLDKMASQILWPLFIAVTILVDGTYAKLGAIIALGVVISLFSANMYGKFIDNKKGLFLLQYNVILNSYLYLLRPFISTTAGAVAVSTLNEPITLGYQMPLFKGYFDDVDTEEGYRIVYLSWVEGIGAIVKFLFFLSLYLASFWFDPISVLKASFILAAFITLAMLMQRFPALKKS